MVKIRVFTIVAKVAVGGPSSLGPDGISGMEGRAP
jgi:hypothetical protein